MKKINFIDKHGSFRIDQAEKLSYLYYPVASSKGLKCAVTPRLHGDSKLDQNHFLLEPTSCEDLHQSEAGRNFWCKFEDGSFISAVGNSALQEAKFFTKEADSVQLESGFMWQKAKRIIGDIEATTLSFVPVEENFEVMQVTIENRGDKEVSMTPFAAIPIYGRSADNIRDHRHVTALLHRTFVMEEGIAVAPTFSFDERGHKVNDHLYYVFGSDDLGNKPVKFYPILETFVGEGGSLHMPEAIAHEVESVAVGEVVCGYESMGAFEFDKVVLKSGEKKTYTLLLGIEEVDPTEASLKQTVFDIAKKRYESYGTLAQMEPIFEQTKEYWKEAVNISFETKDALFDGYMKWISFQPMLRRIFGCSFLPHHDYGKGGRGWRDLWQDILALLLMGGDGLGEMLINNFQGVRVDGSNATIIGSKPGEFIADRNNITRVWMDHGLWPFMTSLLYIHQTGNYDLLFEHVSYFKDKQVLRGSKVDVDYNISQGVLQKTEEGTTYLGSIIEHLLLQNLTAFYEVGEHNHMKLRGADWNDALDMAEERGESVAFTAAYGGNLSDLAELLEKLVERMDIEHIEILEEMLPLLQHNSDLYNNKDAKNQILEDYCKSVMKTVSGKKVKVEIQELILSLRGKAEWIREHVRNSEWLEEGWFNSYYDDHGRQVEGTFDGTIRMMLTGQVFTIMSKTATNDQIESMVKAADRHLFAPDRGGYALNTDFGHMKTDLGRMFGFAYGHKENGAVFSHMTTMYANALYSRGFVKEGYQALDCLMKQAQNIEVSKILPGIPEYYNDLGRGMYHYLTGSASWFLLTVVTQMFGVRGDYGNLMLEPKLVEEQFDENNEASISLLFQGKSFVITVVNKERKEYGEYVVGPALVNGVELPFQRKEKSIILPKSLLDELDLDKQHKIIVELV